MLELNRLLRKFDSARREQSDMGAAVFEDWRSQMTSAMAAYLRAVDQGARIDAMFGRADLHRKTDSAEGIAAAYHLLTYGSDELADTFISGSLEIKASMIAAVASDGGCFDGRDRWVEFIYGD